MCKNQNHHHQANAEATAATELQPVKLPKYLKLDPDMLRRSIKEVNEIYSHASSLEDLDVNYGRRFFGFSQLGIDGTGFTAFHPTITRDLAAELKEISSAEAEVFYRKYDAMTYDDPNLEAAAIDWRLARYIVNYITNENITGNSIPEQVTQFIKENDIRGYSTPKLSKLLVKFFGEQSATVTKFNSLPRKLEQSAAKEWSVVLSVLPHHIAGMSRYSTYNTHPDQISWQGYAGTSCQDPIQNDGDLVNCLPASLKENTLAVAYLTKSDISGNIFEPQYYARALVRIVKHGKKRFFLVCRAYGTTPNTRALLHEALQNQYPGKVFSLEWMGRTYGSFYNTQSITVKIEDVRHYSHTHEICDNCNEGYNECYTCDGNRNIECSNCNGTGELTFWNEDDDGNEYENTHECRSCNGEGEVECSSCEGTGSQTCSTCGGDYESEDSDTYHPYIDDTSIIRMRNTEIGYDLPEQFIKEHIDLEESSAPEAASNDESATA